MLRSNQWVSIVVKDSCALVPAEQLLPVVGVDARLLAGSQVAFQTLLVQVILAFTLTLLP